MVLLDTAAKVTEFLANSAQEANWEDLAHDNDDESNIMNCQADVLSGFHVHELHPNTPHPCEIIAASVRRLRLSKLREKWGRGEKCTTPYAAALRRRWPKTFPLLSGMSGRRRSSQSPRATATATAPLSGCLFRAIAGSTRALTTRWSINFSLMSVWLFSRWLPTFSALSRRRSCQRIVTLSSGGCKRGLALAT